MSTVAIVIIAVAALVVLTVVGIVLERSIRRRKLQERFGPEYDRTVSATNNSREAEADLRERAAERDRLSIRPLSAAQRDRYEQDWRQVQAEFEMFQEPRSRSRRPSDRCHDRQGLSDAGV